MNFSATSSPQFDMLTAINYWLVQFYNSPFVFAVKILIGFYIFILLVDIVLLLILRDVPGHFRTGVRGMDIPIISKGKMKKRWDKITGRLSSGDVSQYKIAVLEADALVDDILAGIGYKGQNMGEKFDQMESTHLDSHHETLKDAHSVRNRIVQEADFSIDQQTAHNVLAVYEDFLKYLEYLD
jgi:hypothetical protein